MVEAGGEMTPKRRPTGVCVIRAEPQSRRRLIISVTTSADAEAGVVRLAQKTTDRDEALELIAEFLDECQRS